LLSGSTVLSSWVTKLRDIPLLVTELGGDANNIVEFKHKFPAQTALYRHLSQLVGPKLVFHYDSMFGSNNPSSEVWRHSLVGFAIPPVEGSEIDAWIDRVFRLLVKGVPTASGGVPMDQISVHANLYPMDVTGVSRTWIPGQDAGMDVAQFSFTFAEWGDA
jgi:hypothetical protein